MLTLTDRAKRVAALLVTLTGVVLALVVGPGHVHWTDVQVALVSATSGTGIAFLVVVVQHFDPTSSKEPVLILGAFSPFLTSFLLMLTGLGVWGLSQSDDALIVSAAVIVLGIPGALFARAKAEPVGASGATGYPLGYEPPNPAGEH